MAGRTELLEREAELARIDQMIAASISGSGRFFIVEGRSGMGKTALLDEVKVRAQRAGLSVCAARGTELESGFAYGVVRQLFEPLVRRLGSRERARLFHGAAALAAPVLGVGSHLATSPVASLHGLYWLVIALASRGPLVLVVDDTHWADAQSVRWLGYLLNRLEGLPVVVALAARTSMPNDVVRLIAGLASETLVEVLELAPLGEASVSSLVRAGLGKISHPQFIAACHRATAGNPLALRMLVHDLAQRGVEPTEGAAMSVARHAPDAVSRSVAARLVGLSDAATTFARALAVLGDASEVRLVAALANVADDDAFALADDLARADLVAPERPLRFVHPLLRSAIYDAIPMGLRTLLHRRAADALAAQQADPEAIAAHLLRCEPTGRTETIEHLIRAAPAAVRRGVPQAAVAYLRRGLAEPSEGTARVNLLAELGRAEVRARDPAAVEHLRLAIENCGDPALRAALRMDLADAFLWHGWQGPSIEQLRLALLDLGDQQSETAARINVQLAGQTSHDPRFAVDNGGTVARMLSIAKGDEPAARLAHLTVAFLLASHAQRCDEVTRHVATGLEDGSFLAAEGADSHFAVLATFALVFVDDLVGASHLAGEMLRESAARGSILGFATASSCRALAELRGGLLAEAEADSRAALEVAQEHELNFMVPSTAAILGCTLLYRGRLQDAGVLLEDVRFAEGTGQDSALLEARGRIRCASGRLDEGIADLRACGANCDAAMITNQLVHGWRSPLAIALGHGSPEEGRRLAEADLQLARCAGLPRWIGSALCTMAAFERDVDRTDMLSEAVAVLEATAAPLELAKALIELGSALRRQGHSVEARVPLQQALEHATRCGAVALAEQARVEALAAGARPRRPRLRGLDALTPSELRVARQAAQGLANREIAQALFITPKTVKDHLGSTYSKLGIRSRTELRAALSQSDH